MDRNEYLEIVSAQVRCKRAVPYLKEELENHIEDQKEAYISSGMNPFEAEMAAVHEMGDPVETGVALDQVHRPKMEWKVVVAVLIMGAIGLGIQIVLANSYFLSNGGVIEGNYWTDYWEDYWPILDIVGKQFLGYFAGTLLMIFICYLDYSILMKWSFPIWIILHALIIVSCMMGPTVNGRSTQAIQITYMLAPFYAGVVYHYRGKALKGLIKCILLLSASFVIIMQIPDASAGVVTLLTGIVVLGFAIYHKWFGECKGKMLVGVLSGLLLFGVAGVKYVDIPLSSYYALRIEAWLSGESFGYLLQAVKEAAQNVNTGAQIEQFMLEYIRNNYIWAYLFEYLGTWKGSLLIFVFLGFIAVLFWKVLHQKNRLGYIVGIGCLTYLCIQGVVYIGNNFNLVPLGGCYMPFYSNGVIPLLATYFYMGILLSVFRNSTVVRN